MKGFTLIEAMLCFCIVWIIAMIFIVSSQGIKSNNELSFGFNGIAETRCIGSYRFVIGHDGQARQVLDEFGKGAKCEDK